MRDGRAPRNRHGFTIVELTVTLALLGVVIVIGVQRLDSSSWRLDSAAQEVVQTVRAARSVAVLKQHDVVVTLDVGQRRIIVHEDANNNGTVEDGERVRSEVLDGNAEFLLEGVPPYGEFSSGPVTFSNQTVTFLRNGSASQEGAVYISEPSIAKARVVVVRRATGYTELLRFNGESWLEN